MLLCGMALESLRPPPERGLALPCSLILECRESSVSLQTNDPEDVMPFVLASWDHCMSSSLGRPQLEARPHNADRSEAGTQCYEYTGSPSDILPWSHRRWLQRSEGLFRGEQPSSAGALPTSLTYRMVNRDKLLLL